MGILVECPKCKTRGSTTRKVCKCGYQPVASPIIEFTVN